MNCGCTIAAERTSSKRRETKELIEMLSKTNPDIKKKILLSSFNVNVEKILAFKYKGKKISYLDDYEIIENKDKKLK